MDKKERFNQAYEHLYKKGIIHEQKDLAAMMKASKSNISSALKGKESVLTDNFIRRFCNAFKGTFNEDWILTGEGEMLIKQEKPFVMTLEERYAQIIKDNTELIAMLKDEKELNRLLMINIANELSNINLTLRQMASGQTVQSYNVTSGDVNPAALNDKLNQYK